MDADEVIQHVAAFSAREGALSGSGKMDKIITIQLTIPQFVWEGLIGYYKAGDMRPIRQAMADYGIPWDAICGHLEEETHAHRDCLGDRDPRLCNKG